MMHSLAHSSFHQALGNAPRLMPYSSNTRNTWCLGSYSFENDDKVECPVYLTIPANPKNITCTVKERCNWDKAPFILLAPTNRWLSADSELMLIGRKCASLALENAFTLQDDGSFLFKIN